MTTQTLRALAVVGIAFACACASNPARSAATVPLQIPEPPPRVALDPVPANIELPSPPNVELPPIVPAARPAPKPVPATPVAAAPVTPPPPAVTVPEPSRTPPPDLRPAGPLGSTPNASQVRDRIVRTRQKLDQVDPRRLNPGRRTDFDSARRFLAQAEAAANDNNFMLAESSVDKAETLADALR
jgi:hypothetical protein